MRDPFYDGVFIDANRTNEASGRSWHIPDEEREPSRFILGVAIVAVFLIGMAFIGAIDGMIR